MKMKGSRSGRSAAASRPPPSAGATGGKTEAVSVYGRFRPVSKGAPHGPIELLNSRSVQVREYEFTLDGRQHSEVRLGLGPLKEGRGHGTNVVGGCRRSFRLARRLACCVLRNDRFFGRNCLKTSAGGFDKRPGGRSF